MKTFTNTAIVEKNQKLGFRFSMAGLLLMSLSLVLIFLSNVSFLAWPVLVGGVVVAAVGSYYVNRWVRPPLPEPLLNEAFQRLDQRHLLFNHMGTVPHLLLTPKGLIAIKAKRYEGPVRYDAATDKWKGRISLRRFYGQGFTAEGLGKPAQEVAELRAALDEWLKKTVPEVAATIPVEVVLFFFQPKTELDVDDSPLVIARPDTLRDVVHRLFAKRKPLPREVYKRLRTALEAEVPDGATATPQ